jgi:hypothetical protein
MLIDEEGTFAQSREICLAPGNPLGLPVLTGELSYCPLTLGGGDRGIV